MHNIYQTDELLPQYYEIDIIIIIVFIIIKYSSVFPLQYFSGPVVPTEKTLNRQDAWDGVLLNDITSVKSLGLI